MVMGGEPALRQQRGRVPMWGLRQKELKQTQYGVKVVKGGATRDVWGSEI